jgi:hypothetical protein
MGEVELVPAPVVSDFTAHAQPSEASQSKTTATARAAGTRVFLVRVRTAGMTTRSQGLAT